MSVLVVHTDILKRPISSPVACGVKTSPDVPNKPGVHHFYMPKRGAHTNQAKVGHQNIVLIMGPAPGLVVARTPGESGRERGLVKKALQGDQPLLGLCALALDYLP